MFSLESPQRGDSNEYTHYTISKYKKENHPKLSQICNSGICSKGPKNKFETAVVNEPSVFEPLKFYCNTGTYVSFLLVTGRTISLTWHTPANTQILYAPADGWSIGIENVTKL